MNLKNTRVLYDSIYLRFKSIKMGKIIFEMITGGITIGGKTIKEGSNCYKHYYAVNSTTDRTVIRLMCKES